MKDAFDVSDWKDSPKHLLESDIENPSKKKARAAGWWVRKFKAPKMSSEPDDIFAKNGRVFFVEFKAPGKKATEKQLKAHKEMREAGLTVYVCDNLELFDEILAIEEKNATTQ